MDLPQHITRDLEQTRIHLDEIAVTIEYFEGLTQDRISRFTASLSAALVELEHLQNRIESAFGIATTRHAD